GFSGNLIAGLRSLAGGEIHEYTQLLEDTRRQALDRLVKNATLMGANAVISMRFDSSELAGTMSEIVAYGTAGGVEPAAKAPQPGEWAFGWAPSCAVRWSFWVCWRCWVGSRSSPPARRSPSRGCSSSPSAASW